jgi:HD superfamily phosphohydrolase
VEFRDPLHGGISLLPEEIPVVSDDFCIRLKHIKQMGLSEHLFPGATHSRFLHSLGVMHLSQVVFTKLFGDNPKLGRIRITFRMAALLHDIGHPPLSHTTESAMPGGLNHESYSARIINERAIDLTKIIKRYGVDVTKVANLITGTNDDDYFEEGGLDYFPILHQLISGELDCDRMDYLLRDSFFCGVAYGNFDLPWIIDNLRPVKIKRKLYLGIDHKALITFDDFLISRLHMFLMVYFHYKSVCMEMLLLKYLKDSGEYTIPYQLSDYKNHDDNHLIDILKKSSHPLAKNILKNRIPDRIFESSSKEEESILKKIENFMQEEKIEYFKCSSSSRISKYDTGNHLPLKVVAATKISDITTVSNSFKKLAGNYQVTRVYAYPEALSRSNLRNIERIVKMDI